MEERTKAQRSPQAMTLPPRVVLCPPGHFQPFPSCHESPTGNSEASGQLPRPSSQERQADHQLHAHIQSEKEPAKRPATDPKQTTPHQHVRQMDGWVEWMDGWMDRRADRLRWMDGLTDCLPACQCTHLRSRRSFGAAPIVRLPHTPQWGNNNNNVMMTKQGGSPLSPAPDSLRRYEAETQAPRSSP